VSISDCKPPKNKAERLFYDLAKEKGYVIARRGWPDYLVYDEAENRYFAVEVKPSKDCPLKGSQIATAELLTHVGLDTLVWSPDIGYRTISQVPRDRPKRQRRTRKPRKPKDPSAPLRWA
jgi:hypothetical protein